MSFVIEKKVPIDLYRGKWVEKSGVRVLTDVKPLSARPEWFLAVAHFEAEPERKIFAVTDEYDSYRAWNYRLNEYFVPSKVLERVQENEYEAFFFDIGSGSYYPVWAELADLRKAFVELGLVEDS